VEPRDVARVSEAFMALEAAIAEAWPPPKPKPKPDLLPGVLATTAAQDAPQRHEGVVWYCTDADGVRRQVYP
jgi:hypothetical protein